MLTLDMMKLAKENRKTYITKDLLYSSANGFTDKKGRLWPSESFDTLNYVMTISTWKETNWDVDAKAMTKKEIEKELGYRVNIIEE